MGLIKTLIVSGAAVAIVKDFNKEKRRKREAEEFSKRQQHEFQNGIPTPSQHGQPGGYSQPQPPAQADQQQQYDFRGGNQGHSPPQYLDQSHNQSDPYKQSTRALDQVDASGQQGLNQLGNAPPQYYGQTNGKATSDDQFSQDPK